MLVTLCWWSKAPQPKVTFDERVCLAYILKGESTMVGEARQQESRSGTGKSHHIHTQKSEGVHWK